MKKGLICEKSNTPGMGALYINYDGAANIEEIGERGLSHLAEHLLCKHYDDLQEELMAAGIVSNAMTTDKNVVFYWVGLNDKIEEFQDRLLGLINYLPTKDQFDIEKSIVMQEYQDYISQQQFVFGNIQRKYFDYFGPIGYRDDITGCTYEGILKFINKNMSKPNQIIRIGKSKTIKKLCKGIKYEKPVTPKDYKQKTEVNDLLVESPSSFNGSGVVADWITLNTSEFDYRDILVYNSMFSRGLSSPLYKEIREKRGLVYYVGLDSEKISNSSMIWTLYGGCVDSNLEEVRFTFKECITNYAAYITPERFKSTIECFRNKHIMMDISNTSYGYVRKFMIEDNSDITLDYLNGLTYEYMLGVCAKMAIAVLGMNKAYISKEINI